MAGGETIGRNVAEWRRRRGLSALGLAKTVGVRVFTIQQIEAGKTQRSRHLPAIARALSVTLDKLDPDIGPVSPADDEPARIPVHGTTEAGDGVLVINPDPVEWQAPPPSVAQVRGAYGVMVTGESMWPMVRPGDVVIINPHKYPRREDLCVFRSEQHGQFKSTIKEFVSATNDGWRVKRYRPEEREFTLKKPEWSECHVVVMTLHRP